MAINPAAAAALKVLDRAEDGIWLSLEAACRAYAIGLRAKPIVDRHFTPGNAERYGFAPLSRAYFLAKQRGLVSHRGASHFLSPAEHRVIGRLQEKHARRLKTFRSRKGEGAESKADTASFRHAQAAENRAEMHALLDKILHGRQGSKLDDKAGFRSSSTWADGTQVTGIGAGKNLPTLVLTGRLRQAVAAKNATIVVNRASGVATITFHGLPEYALYLHEGTPKMPARSPVEPCADDIAMVRKAAAQFYDDYIGKARANPIRQPTNAR